MLFAFSINSMYAQESARSTFISGCLSDAPNGFTEAEVALLYADQCGDTSPQVVKTITQDGSDCDWTSVITYDVTCGDFVDQFKIDYFGGDNTAPLLNDGVEVPTGGQDLNLCFDNVPNGPSEQDIAALYSDNCSDVLVTKSGTPSGSDCEWSVTYVYTIADACENMATDIEVTYSGGDNQAPQLNKKAVIPTGETGLNLCFSNKAQGPTVEDIAALYFDNCGNVNVTKEEQSKGTDCKWQATYTYTIQDDCSNFAQSIVLIYSGGDLEAPELQGVPGDVTVNCIDDIPAPGKGEVFATDNCAIKVSVNSSDDLSGLNGTCLGGVVVRTYTATDDCGRSVSETQTITVLESPMADFDEAEGGELTCEEANAFEASPLGYTNGAAGSCEISGSVDGFVTTDYTNCGGFLYVDYTYTDDCDRTINEKLTYTVLPTPVASFDEVEDMEISCEEANVFQAGSLGYSNGASGACEISGSVEGEATPDYTVCGGTITVNWTYTDDCERTINAEQVVTVLPAPMAEFDAVQNMEISCEEANAFQAISLAYTNGGTGACEISGSVNGEATPDYTECGGTITVNWTYTDDCERTINAEQIVTVLPAPMAEFDEVEGGELTCEEAYAFEAGSLAYTNGGTGACEISGSVDGQVTSEFTLCGGFLYVDYTYTDDCERTINAKQTFTVLPAPMAEFDEVEDMEISCEEANSFQASSLGYSNGAAGSCEISGSVDGEATPDYTECGGTITVNWTYTDDCDRTINAEQTVTVLPAPMAEFDEVEDMEISCEEANAFQASSLAYTNGGTGACEISGSVDGEATPDYTECGGKITVNWTYTGPRTRSAFLWLG